MSSLVAAAAEAGVRLSDAAAARLATYRDLIVAAAARFNLTALRDPAAAESRHIVESLALAALLERQGLLPAAARVIDIGSGAGLPGLPLKIARPDLEVTLLEANGKRCAFLREAIATLGLDGVRVVEGRAETVAHVPGEREAYDLALARAVAPLPVLLEYALPFLKQGGHLAATKGSAVTREVAAAGRALALLGGEIIAQLPFIPPGGMPQTLVVVRKLGQTPPAYPRRPGIPSKRPLL